MLHRTEQRVLLCLVETVNLVDEEYGSATRAEETAVFGCFDYFAHLFYATCNGREGKHLTAEGESYEPCEGGFTHPGRTPEDERGDVAALDETAYNAPLTDQMCLADVFVEALWPESFCEWCVAHSCSLAFLLHKDT